MIAATSIDQTVAVAKAATFTKSLNIFRRVAASPSTWKNWWNPSSSLSGCVVSRSSRCPVIQDTGLLATPVSSA
jgi:hypothetical protein